MQRNFYIALFVVILLIACIGGFLGGRVLLQRMQADFAPRNATAAPTTIAQVATPAPLPTELPAPTAGPQPTKTVMVVDAPVTDQPPVLGTPEPTWTAGVALPTSDFALPTATVEFLPVDGTPFGQTPGETGAATPLPSATPVGNFPFSPRGAVRYTNGDCPGTYMLGLVADRAGNPLPGIRLSLVDEYGNAATAVTKPGPGDTGRYDFPMGGPARKFYLQIVDDAGRGLSPRVEILHELPPYEGKGCRWLDWRRS